jgi:hypothetical protein
MMLNELPVQIEPLLTATTGKAATVTDETAVLEPAQPCALVPVTLYEAVPVGLTVKVPPEIVYVLAPDGMIVKDLPEQILPLLTEITGTAFTVTVDTAVFDETQPAALVPVTE